MNKQEVLKKHFDVDEMYGRSNMEGNGIYVAMDEYAKQESIDFGKFISANGWQQYDEADRWISPSNNNDVITTKQLYEKYDAHKNTA